MFLITHLAAQSDFMSFSVNIHNFTPFCWRNFNFAEETWVYLIMGCCPDIAGGCSERWDWGNHIRHPTAERKKGRWPDVTPGQLWMGLPSLTGAEVRLCVLQSVTASFWKPNSLNSTVIPKVFAEGIAHLGPNCWFLRLFPPQYFKLRKYREGVLFHLYPQCLARHVISCRYLLAEWDLNIHHFTF